MKACRMGRAWLLGLALLLASLGLAHARALWPSPSQWQQLRERMGKENEARRVLTAQRRLADEALRHSPQPVEVLPTAKLFAGEDRKMQTEAGLQDMTRIQALAVSYQLWGDERYLRQAGAILDAWAGTNRPTGQPIDETGLEPAIFGYRLVRPRLPSVKRERIDRWLSTVAEAEIASRDLSKRTATNNWHSHRLKTVGLIGFALGDKGLINYAREGLHRQLSDNLLPSGGSIDLIENDALSCHVYDLRPLVTLALAFAEQEEDFYHWRTTRGASLAKSMDYLMPYLTGVKTHPEFVGSQVAFDKARSDHHEEGHRIGALYDPKNALPLLELAAGFDARYAKLAHTLGGGTPHLRLLLSSLPGR